MVVGRVAVRGTCRAASYVSVASVPGSVGFAGSQAGYWYVKQMTSGFRGPAATVSRASGWVTAAGTGIDITCRIFRR